MISTFLITHRKSKYDTSLLISRSSEVITKFSSHKLEVLHDDVYTHSEVRIFDLVCSELYLPLLMARWNLRGKRSILSAGKESAILALQMLFGIYELLRSFLIPRNKAFLVTKNLRILNISDSHLKAWTKGLESGSEFILVMEDDCFLEDVGGFELVVKWIIQQIDASESILVDLSNSFTFLELGVEPMSLKPVGEILGSGQVFIETSIPVTNTCAAIIFTAEMATELRSFLSSAMYSKLYRAVPIDWQINRFLMMANYRDRVKTLHLTPGLFLQTSMHNTLN